MIFDQPYVKRPHSALEWVQRTCYEVALGTTHRRCPIIAHDLATLAFHYYPDDVLLQSQWAYILKTAPKLTKVRPGFVYLLDGGGYVKIGKANVPNKRILQFSPRLPFTCEVVGLIASMDPLRTECIMHHKLASYHARGEWFSLDEHILQNILSIPFVVDDQQQLEWALEDEGHDHLIGLDVSYYENYRLEKQ